MNNIKISQLDENTSPSLSAVTVVVQNDIAKKSTIQTIKETIFSDDVDLTGNLMVDGNTSLTGNLSVTGNTNLNGNTTIQGDTKIINTWTTPNNTQWKIVTYNGQYSGSARSGTTHYWFSFSGVPFSNNTNSCANNKLRSGMIEYTAYFSGAGTGSEIGQIMFSRNCDNLNDNWVVSQQSGDDIIVTDGDNGGFYFYNNDNNNEVNMLIQWTAKLFYNEENWC
jgi:hypothetical protein